MWTYFLVHFKILKTTQVKPSLKHTKLEGKIVQKQTYNYVQIDKTRIVFNQLYLAINFIAEIFVLSVSKDCYVYCQITMPNSYKSLYFMYGFVKENVTSHTRSPHNDEYNSPKYEEYKRIGIWGTLD